MHYKGSTRTQVGDQPRHVIIFLYVPLPNGTGNNTWNLIIGRQKRQICEHKTKDVKRMV